MKECPRCLLTDDIKGVIVGEKQCNYCDLHDRLDKEYPISAELEQNMVARIKKRGAKKKYDCIMGASGGSDSSYLLYWAKQNNLRTLVFHFDNGFNKDLAERNMTRLLDYTGFDLIRVKLNTNELNDLNTAFLLASVSDNDIPNDIAMGSIIQELAIKFDIKTILYGHSFRTEGSVPIGWTYMDGAYIKDVYETYIKKQLQNYPLLSIWLQIKVSLKGIKNECPFYYMNHSKQQNKDFLKEKFGWESYAGRHCENKYTEFAGWVSYKKFGIDKRRIELSALIRSGVINKKVAKLMLEEPINEPDCVKEIKERLDLWDYDVIMMTPRRMFYEFNTYQKTFIKYKWLIWIGYKLGFLRKTFYVKYTKKI